MTLDIIDVTFFAAQSSGGEPASSVYCPRKY
jgi:hypothetical protein